MKYNYSYSGADCDVFATRDGVNGGPIHLENISTVSISMYEAKAPVRRLGHAAPVGFTGNIRSIAGSLIFVVVREHPLREVMNKFERFNKHVDDEISQKGFAQSKDVFNAGMIKPFNLMLMYKNEVDKLGAGIRINNVEFISEGIVTSVNDMVTEVVLQFVATEIDQLELEKPIGKETPKKKTKEEVSKKKPGPIRKTFNNAVYELVSSNPNVENPIKEYTQEELADILYIDKDINFDSDIRRESIGGSKMLEEQLLIVKELDSEIAWTIEEVKRDPSKLKDVIQYSLVLKADK